MEATLQDSSILWTSEQVLGLAADKYSLKTGRGFATPERWLCLGRNQYAAWGEFPIKDKPPLQIKINLTDLTIACGCASRKFPCYHGLGLLLLLVEQPGVFLLTPPPEWLSAWLIEYGRATDNKTKGKRPSAKHIQQRQATIQTGLQELDLWLRDMVRSGFATLPDKPKNYWSQMADRMIDAQAGEVARTIRDMALIPGSHPAWPEQLLRHIGHLHLLIQGFNHFEALSPAEQANLRAAVGWSLREERDEAEACLRDQWQVLGRHLTQTGKQKTQHTWLWGETSNSPALILDVIHGKQLVDTSLVVGSVIEADLYFYPSATPLRADLRRRYGTRRLQTPVTGYPSIQTAIQAYAQAIALNPWLSRFPMALQNVRPERLDERWIIRDPQDAVLPLPKKFSHGWHLRALSSNGPFSIFGEWDGVRFQPLTVWWTGRLLELHILGGVK